MYAGAPHQLTAGWIGWSGLCSLIKPLIDGVNGLRFMCFHFSSGGISALLLFMTFLTWVWKASVRLVLEARKLLDCMNCSTLFS